MLNMLNFNDILRRISQSQKHHNQQCSKEIQPWHPRAKAPSSLPRDTGPETVPTLEKTPELTSICRFKSNRDYTHLIFAEQKGPKKIKPPPVIHRLPTKEIQKNLWPPPHPWQPAGMPPTAVKKRKHYKRIKLRFMTETEHHHVNDLEQTNAKRTITTRHPSFLRLCHWTPTIFIN